MRFKVVYRCVLKLCQTPRMRLSGFLVNNYFCQSFIVNVWQGFRYISKYVLAHFFRLWKIIRSFKFKTNNSSNNNIENSRPFLPFFYFKNYYYKVSRYFHHIHSFDTTGLFCTQEENDKFPKMRYPLVTFTSEILKEKTTFVCYIFFLFLLTKIIKNYQR